jgi:hypothetical protein
MRTLVRNLDCDADTRTMHCDTVGETTGMHGRSTKASTPEVPAVPWRTNSYPEKVGRQYNSVRIRKYGCSGSLYTGTRSPVPSYRCTRVYFVCTIFFKNHPVLNFRNKYRYYTNKYHCKYICYQVQVSTCTIAKFRKYIIQYNVLRGYFLVPDQTKYLLY